MGKLELLQYFLSSDRFRLTVKSDACDACPVLTWQLSSGKI